MIKQFPFIPLLMLVSASVIADPSADQTAAKEAAFQAQCHAYADAEDVKPAEKVIWFEECVAELHRLDAAEISTTDYAYNH